MMGGLKDLLVDSDVYASYTAEQMLNGRQFHRAVRGLTMCYEALLNRLINSFADWCLQGEGAHKAILVKLESLVLEVHRSTNGKSTSLGPTAKLGDIS